MSRYGPGDKSSWVNGRRHEGETITADFPGSLYMSNIGSKVDGAGMCVMTSIEILAHYLGLTDYYGLRDWCAQEKGGAWPEKVDRQIAAFEKAHGITRRAPYLQYTGSDPTAVLDRLDQAGLPFAHSYSYSPRYPRRIAHMVSNVKFSGKYSVVLDNNPMNDLHPESNEMFEWMSKEEMLKRAGGREIWIFAWLAPPPPPVPQPRSQP